MKKLVLASLALTCAVSVFGQGQVLFGNAVSGSVRAPIYGISPLGNTVSQKGNGATGLPAGTVDWTGYPVLSGSSYVAALMFAPGANAADSALTWAGVTSTFRTGTAVGFFVNTPATLAGVAAGDTATLQVFAWDNSSGAYADPAAAWSAWKGALIAGGSSSSFNLAVGGGTITPPNLVGLTSFNLYMVPEPTTMALAGLGAAALLIFRRRK